MKRLRFDTLAVRIGGTVLAGALLFQFVLLAVVFWPGGPARPVFLLPSPKQALAMASALEKAPPALRPDIVRALNSDALLVRLQPAGAAPAAAPPNRGSARLERLFARYADDLDGRPFHVEVRPGERLNALSANDIGAAAPVSLVLTLTSGDSLVLERTRAPALRRLMDRAVLIGLLGCAILAAVLLVALRQTARPLRALNAASRQLAADLSMPDLPLDGPAEIKDLSRAFNDMKHTIRSLIDDRTRMLAALAHDFRTYLTRLRLRAEFIDDADQRARAVADLDEMNMLLDDTLTFAREVSASGAPAPRLVDLAVEIAALVAVRRELGQDVEWHGEQATLPVACAPLALRRMLDNLIDNAVRYAHGARLTATRDDGDVLVTVEDDGPGVPEEALLRLTLPFERLEGSRARATGGSGLGLSIVLALAASQGGTLGLQNRAEGGLRATLRLPGHPLPPQGADGRIAQPIEPKIK
nr:ATP-binding protein [uncultured Duganella sp.]